MQKTQSAENSQSKLRLKNLNGENRYPLEVGKTSAYPWELGETLEVKPNWLVERGWGGFLRGWTEGSLGIVARSCAGLANATTLDAGLMVGVNRHIIKAFAQSADVDSAGCQFSHLQGGPVDQESQFAASLCCARVAAFVWNLKAPYLMPF